MYEPTNYTMLVINQTNNNQQLSQGISPVIAKIKDMETRQTFWSYQDRLSVLWHFVHTRVLPTIAKEDRFSVLFDMNYLYWYYLTDGSTPFLEWLAEL